MIPDYTVLGAASVAGKGELGPSAGQGELGPSAGHGELRAVAAAGSIEPYASTADEGSAVVDMVVYCYVPACGLACGLGPSVGNGELGPSAGQGELGPSAGHGELRAALSLAVY